MVEEAASRGVLGLRDERFDVLLQHFSEAPTNRAGAVADMLTDRAVQLIRLGSREDLAAAGETLAQFLAGERSARVAEAAPGPFRQVEGLLSPLAAATAPDSLGGEQLVLRDWAGNARKALEFVARANGQRLPRAELRSLLGVSESYLSHLLLDVESAGLLERIAEPGRKAVNVHLGPRGRALAAAGEFDRPENHRPAGRARRPSPRAGGDAVGAIEQHGVRPELLLRVQRAKNVERVGQLLQSPR